jgi:hypothetical protein
MPNMNDGQRRSEAAAALRINKENRNLRFGVPAFRKADIATGQLHGSWLDRWCGAIGGVETQINFSCLIVRPLS